MTISAVDLLRGACLSESHESPLKVSTAQSPLGLHHLFVIDDGAERLDACAGLGNNRGGALSLVLPAFAVGPSKSPASFFGRLLGAHVGWF